ncbi:prolyl oligopeptidase family serine peptidase [Streptococcus parasanguinis]|uniref:CocE/NonD family hydrolase n=1 Tax=Streptococcus parasanguinis TaxID=1318 RepID=UPI001D077DCE|nr:CocE/NonD family hydrolase [Streptococcus parasanguinis]MCB6703558.1 prolyl oligopeptidase family serine peptidase [Streptococcus parasanguinis]MCB6738277.1 prolyl oligopeptidase family serine peptidase [Streptococcus parasanguinis]MCB7322306.1 prolyl oligopeptidase family serine peptidase [Streptococcus parasanguinis]MCB7401210.1 prolyl oligopeptidase family serine peptidase [Streptococcus parasanguinis]
MKKKTMVSIVASSLLIAPMVLHQVAAADEQTEELAPSTEVVHAPSTEAIPTASDTSTATSEEGASSSEGSLDRTAVANKVAPATEEHTRQSESSVPVATPAATNREAGPQSAPTSEAPATSNDLAKVTGSTLAADQASKELTVQDAVNGLLQWAATDPSQLGQSQADRERFAKSLGLIEKSEDLSRKVSQPELAKMYETAKKLYDAYRAEKKRPLFLNGRAQPIFPYTTGEKADQDYKYEDSQIVRFPVYVETDYDTDADGKPDLVKAIVQLPKAVAQGDFKAATILEARPYVAGTLDENYVTLESLGLPTDGSYDMKKLHSQPAKRQPVSSETTVEAAKKAKASDWYYYSPYEYIYDYEDLNWYDYFLVRGYAFISSAGLGTKGSEGFNTTGSDLEINAFKNIIEWVNGKRKAYTDKTSNIEIKADWATGNVAMTGLSWAGTTTFGVAATGVEGLKTIVPAAGIASWYDYFNSQGTQFSNAPYSDLSWLSLYVSTRMLDQDDWAGIWQNYSNYINQLNKDQYAHDRNYSDVWKERDYTLHPENLKTSALIVHGLNDDNVKTKHFELMYDALKKAGQDVKLYLHQGDHVYPAAMSRGYGITANGQDFYDLLNTWLTHYLYGVDNHVESLPAVLAQNNYDPSKWTSYDNWKSSQRLFLNASSKRLEETISSDYAAAGVEIANRNETVSKASSKANLTFVSDVTEDTTIKGHIPVHFKAALAKGQGKNFQINALLVDVADEDFDVVGNGSVKQDKTADGFWMGSNLSNLSVAEYETIKTKYKVIAKGWINLANPESGYDSASSRASIEPKVGEYHDYTVYLQPNLYTVKKGHKLALVFNTYDPSDLTVEHPYEVTFKTDSIQAAIPIVEKTRAQKASYVPSARDTDYANLPEVKGAALVAPEVHYKEEYTLPSPEYFVQPNQTVPEKEEQMQTGSARQEQPHLTLAVSYGSRFVTTTSESVTEDPQEVTSAVGGEQADHMLPQTGSKDHALGLFGVISLTASSLIFWRKKREDA